MPEDLDERFVIEDALRGPLGGGAVVMTAEDMARKHGKDGLDLRNLIRANHDDLFTDHREHEPYPITPEIEARILALPGFQAVKRRDTP